MLCSYYFLKYYSLVLKKLQRWKLTDTRRTPSNGYILNANIRGTNTLSASKKDCCLCVVVSSTYLIYVICVVCVWLCPAHSLFTLLVLFMWLCPAHILFTLFVLLVCGGVQHISYLRYFKVCQWFASNQRFYTGTHLTSKNTSDYQWCSWINCKLKKRNCLKVKFNHMLTKTADFFSKAWKS